MRRDHQHSITCQCGKQSYFTRREAKQAATRIHPGSRMNAYQCGGLWHVGHLPSAIRHGMVTRTQAYG